MNHDNIENLQAFLVHYLGLGCVSLYEYVNCDCVTCILPDVDVRPSVPSIPTLEGRGGRGGTGGTGGTGSDGGNGGDGGLGTSGDSNTFFGSGDDSGNGEVVVCIELASGNLQRNVSVNVMTVSSPASTGY